MARSNINISHYATLLFNWQMSKTFRACHTAYQSVNKEIDDEIRKESEEFNMEEFIGDMRDEFSFENHGKSKSDQLYHAGKTLLKKYQKAMEEQEYLEAEIWHGFLNVLGDFYKRVF